jgi:hypothetical protein
MLKDMARPNKKIPDWARSQDDLTIILALAWLYPDARNDPTQMKYFLRDLEIVRVKWCGLKESPDSPLSSMSKGWIRKRDFDMRKEMETALVLTPLRREHYSVPGEFRINTRIHECDDPDEPGYVFAMFHPSWPRPDMGKLILPSVGGELSEWNMPYLKRYIRSLGYPAELKKSVRPLRSNKE